MDFQKLIFIHQIFNIIRIAAICFFTFFALVNFNNYRKGKEIHFKEMFLGSLLMVVSDLLKFVSDYLRREYNEMFMQYRYILVSLIALVSLIGIILVGKGLWTYQSKKVKELNREGK